MSKVGSGRGASGGWVNRLWLALEYNDVHTTKQILGHGGDVNHIFKEHGHQRRGLTPIFIAVSKNFKELVTILVEAGSNLEQTDAFGETPLFMACRRGKLPMLKQIVNSGANVNHLNNKSENVIFLAIKQGRKDLVDYLISININMDIINSDGSTPLLLALELLSENYLCTNTRATRQRAPSNMAEISEQLIPLSNNLNHNHPNKGAALRMTLAIETQHSSANLHLSKMLMQHGAIPDRLFFLRFGGLQAATTPQGSEFFTEEFFGLALDAGAALQKEKTWLLTVLQQMSQELQPYEQLFEQLLDKAMSPMPLQSLCQINIRTMLGGCLWSKIDKLPLPSTLKECLKLKYSSKEK